MINNRLNQLFQNKKQGILSVYFTAGFPSLEDTVPTLETLQASGVDLIEIGMPFSDPLADGPVIQESSTQAISNGMSIPKLFEQLEGIRSKIKIPLVLMGYLNPVMQYGFEAFCKKAAEIGIDGLILPDLPLKEYQREYKSTILANGLHNIFLITPQTSDERIRLIDSETQAFIYMVSTASTTGTKEGTADSQIEYFNRVNGLQLKNPRVIGFGISNRENFEKACIYASGAIIGSAFVKAVGSEGMLTEKIERFIGAIRA